MGHTQHGDCGSEQSTELSRAWTVYSLTCADGGIGAEVDRSFICGVVGVVIPDHQRFCVLLCRLDAGLREFSTEQWSKVCEGRFALAAVMEGVWKVSKIGGLDVVMG